YAVLEAEIRNYFIWNIKQVRDYFFSIKPFVAYLLAKLHEINLIKKIYIEVENGLNFDSGRDIVYV
ncbi:MAG: hypothetical protein ACLFQV_09250, partial [Vulcanimicrobiota bacterium]